MFSTFDPPFLAEPGPASERARRAAGAAAARVRSAVRHLRLPEHRLAARRPHRPRGSTAHAAAGTHTQARAHTHIQAHIPTRAHIHTQAHIQARTHRKAGTRAQAQHANTQARRHAHTPSRSHARPHGNTDGRRCSFHRRTLLEGFENIYVMREVKPSHRSSPPGLESSR